MSMTSEIRQSEPTYTTFVGPLRLVTAPLPVMLRQTKLHLESKGHQDVIVFADATGRHADFDFSGTLEQMLERALPSAKLALSQPVGPGRPKLGVVSREVSLLPRHWQWLEGQRGGASAALRRLIDEARKADPAGERRRQTTDAAGRFMTVMAGDLLGYEEAARALYTHDTARLQSQIAGWPEAVQSHILYLLDPPFSLQG